MPPRRELVSALACGLLAVILGFGDVVVGRSLVPGDALARDPVFAAGFPSGPQRGAWDTSGVLVHYPAQLEAARQLRSGRLPLWNPRVGLGMPLLAEAHAAPLSPVLWPFVVAPGERAWSLGQLLRPLLMAAGAWLLARRRGTGPAGAALAAATYALSGLAAARFDLPTEGAAYALLPLIALAAWRVVDQGAFGPSPGGAVRASPDGSCLPLAALVGLAFLACHPELAAVAIAAGVALGLGLGHANAHAPGATRAAVVRVGLALAWGTAAAAVVLVPLAAYVLGDGASYKTDALQAGRFAGDLRAFPSAPDLLRVGLAPLFAALVAFAAPGAAGRSVRRLVLGPLAAIVGLFLLQALLPAPWGALLPPRYALFVGSLALALAAGQGLGRLLASPLPARHLLALAFAAAALWALADLATWGRLHRLVDVAIGEGAQALVLTLAVLYAARAPRVLPWSVVGVTAVTLAFSAHRARDGAGAGIPRTAASAALAREAPARVLGIGPWLDRVPLTPNVGGVLGLTDVRAVAAIAPARYRAFFALVDGVRLQPTSTLVERAGSPLLDLLAIDLIAARPEALPAGLTELHREERIVIARRPTPGARAFVPGRLVSAPDAATAGRLLAELAREGALPGAAVVEAPADVLAALGGTARVTITGDAPHEVTLAVDADAPALVVLADTWSDGWRVELDGRPALAWPADLMLRATAVPAGHHRVVWRYRPGGAHAGAWISAGTWLALAAGVVLRRLRPTSGRASA